MTLFGGNRSFPGSVVIREVGPRDGFQAEKQIIPVDLKVHLIESLADAGLSHIQAASFVHPEKVPQMRDGEEVASRLKKRPGVSYSGLALNPAGVRRAAFTNLDSIEISVSASSAHSRKNTGMDADQALDKVPEMAAAARDGGKEVICGIQCAFGCAYQGPVSPDRVAAMAEKMARLDPDALSIADTTGMGTPPMVEDLMSRILELFPHAPVFLHLHDTRGLGLVNMAAALGCGVQWFDASFGGMGGCPFIPGAAGNIPTEDALHFLESLNIRSGVDIGRVSQCSRRMERFLRRVLPGRVYSLY